MIRWGRGVLVEGNESFAEGLDEVGNAQGVEMGLAHSDHSFAGKRIPAGFSGYFS
jgi:hypothetical protein